MSDNGITWVTASAPMPGEEYSGDASVVVDTEMGTLLAVVDGLGHGPEATQAAEAAIKAITEYADAPLVTVIQHCHEALRATRGAAVTLTSVTGSGKLSWVGVGNVDAAIVRSSRDGSRRLEAAFTFGGVVGYQLPPMDERQLELARGDVLVMATDGIRRGYLDTINLFGPLQRQADVILANNSTGRDDALVLLARYDGGPR